MPGMKDSVYMLTTMPGIERQNCAALTVCRFTDSPEETSEFIDMLGLDRSGIASYRRTIRSMKSEENP